MLAFLVSVVNNFRNHSNRLKVRPLSDEQGTAAGELSRGQIMRYSEYVGRTSTRPLINGGAQLS